MVGPDFDPPHASVATNWSESAGTTLIAKAADHPEWWKVFNDPVLDELVQQAHEQNLTLQIAGLRVLQARAELGVASGRLYPQLQQVNAGYNYSYRPDSSAAGGSISSASFGFDAAWELDLWGKYRRAIESADANLFASVASYDDVMVSLSAEVARTYVLIRSLEQRIATAKKNIEIQSRTLEITRALAEGGTVSELDVQQAATALHTTQATVPSLRITLRQTEHALSTLLGLPPEALPNVLTGVGDIPSAPAEVAVGIPADLLRRRPDIRRAEFQAAAQCARIGVAKAELYPSLSLVGTLGWGASDAGGGNLGDVFKSSAFGADVGPSVRWNIFNYGRIQNQVRVQDAAFQELLANYQNVVLDAAREVEDAMVGFLQSREQADFLRQSVESSQRALDLAILQYKEGMANYQRVLDSTRSLTLQQDQYIATQGNITLNLVSMYKALGGGWQVRIGKPFVPEAVQQQMSQRTKWGDLLDFEINDATGESETNHWRAPDW